MYGLLLKTFLRERLSVQRLFGQKIARSTIQRWLMVGLLIYAFGVTAFSTVFLQYEIGVGLLAVNQLNQMLYQGFSQLASLGFLFGFFQAQGYLFQYKDFDLLGPLPIPQRTIIFSKISMMLVFVYLFALVMAIPTFGVWGYLSNASLIQWILLIPMALVTPIPLMLLGSFVSYGIRKMTQAWVNANVLQSIFSVLFILIFAAFSYFSNQWIPQTWLTWLQEFDVLGRWFVEAMVTSTMIPWLFFLLIHGLILFGFVYMMSGPLLAMNQSRTNAVVKNIDKIPTTQQTVLHHLLKKEWQRFIGTSIYLINTGFGLIMLLAATLAIVIFPGAISELNNLLGLVGLHPIWLMFGVIGFSLSTVYTPAVSLSLEGKNFALLKSLPIRAITILQAKVGFNLILTVPLGLVATILGGLTFDLSWLEITLFAIFVLLFTVVLSLGFMVLNLWFPRFDYHHEVEVVKQSLAALFAVFGGFAWMGLMLWLSLQGLSQFNVIGQLFVGIAVQGFVILVVGGWLTLKAEKLIGSLQI
jgi:ABC-2 type transport system permease protein